MRALVLGASIIALGASSALANGPGPAPAAQQPAPTLPPADTPPPATQPPVTQAPVTEPPVGAAPQTGPATAQTTTPPPGPAQRMTQTGGFSLGGLYGYGIDDSDHLAGLNLTFDWGLNPGLALQFEQAGFWNFGDGIGGRSVGGVNFNLGDGTGFIPYIGANIGGIYGNGIDNSWLAGPEIGLVLGPLEAKVAYDMPFNKSWDRGTVVGTLGLGVRF